MREVEAVLAAAANVVDGELDRMLDDILANLRVELAKLEALLERERSA